MKKLILFSLIIVSFVTQAYTDTRPFGMAIYYTRMTNQVLNKVLRFDYDSFHSSETASFEFSKRLNPENIFTKLFLKIGAWPELVANATYQRDNPSFYEFNPFVFFRWHNIPRIKGVLMTMAIGEGVSYASYIPSRERREPGKAKNARKFLNYLTFEVSFASVSSANKQIFYRIHHRSGVFGLYSPGITGSTSVGIGVRFNFS